MNDIEKVSKQGGFNIRHWIVSGNIDHKDVNIAKQNEEKVLGLKWDPQRDKFSYKIRIIFSPKIRKIRSEPDIDRVWNQLSLNTNSENGIEPDFFYLRPNWFNTANNPGSKINNEINDLWRSNAR